MEGSFDKTPALVSLGIDRDRRPRCRRHSRDIDGRRPEPRDVPGDHSKCDESGHADHSGAFVVITNPGAFWRVDAPASLALERIAEIGDPAEAVASLGATPLDAIPPGESLSFEVTAAPGDRFAWAQMLLNSNDAFVGIVAYPFFVGDQPTNAMLPITALDAGTEENAPLFSGFDAGQPDPERGAENLDNGTATIGGTVQFSDQFIGRQASLLIEPVQELLDVSAGGTFVGWTGASTSSADFLAANPEIRQIWVWKGRH